MQPTPTRTRPFWAAAALVLLISGILRFSSLDFGLPHRLTRPDEAPVLELTARVAEGEFDLGWSVYPSAYAYLTWAWGEVVLRGGQALGAFPPGDYLTTLRRRPEILHLIGRSLSALAGTAAVGLLVLLGRRTLGNAAALAAGALLATSFLHVRDSHALKPDALLALAVTAAFLAMLPLARRATFRAAALAGSMAGLAAAMKYPGILLLLPIYLACLMQSESRGLRRLVPPPAIVAGIAAGLVFLCTSPYLLVSEESIRGIETTLALVFPMLFPETAARVAASELPAGAVATLSQGPIVWWGGFVYHATFSLWHGAGKLVALLSPIALVWGLCSGRKMLILVASFVAAYFFVVGLSPTAHLARYMTPLLPPLLLLEAGLLHAATRRLLGRYAGVGFVAAVAIVCAEPLSDTLAHDRILSQTDTRVLATRWMRENLPAGGRVAVHGTQLYPWGAPVIPRTLHRVDAGVTARELEEEGVRYLVTHDHDLVYSTVDAEALGRLAPRLSLVAEFSPFESGGASPLFEASDAYYVPFHRFGGVERAGPTIRIYRFD